MSVKTISVIIPTYNRGEIILDTIASVLAQTVSVTEVVVVDDGSSDNTEEAIAGALAKLPAWKEKVKYHKQTNQGKSVAINNALKIASGEWIAFNDSDDAWDPSKLELQFDAIDKHPECCGCFTDTQFGENKDISTSAISGLKLSGNHGVLQNALEVMAGIGHGIMMQTVIIHRNTMESIGGFDPKLRVSQDSDFLFRLALETPICYVNKPLVILDRDEQRKGRLTRKYPMNSVFRLELRVHMIESWILLARQREKTKLITILNAQLGLSLSYLANELHKESRTKEALSALIRAYRLTGAPKYKIKYVLFLIVPRPLLRIFKYG